MASLKEIRTRMTSVTSTRKVTSAMKMVSASKLRRAQEAIFQIRPYADKLHEILLGLTQSIDTTDGNPYGEDRGSEKVLFVAITSNRGLCGGFNANVIRKINRLLKDEYKTHAEQGKVDVLAIGKKGFDIFRKGTLTISEENKLYDNLDFDHVGPVAQNVMEQFVEGKYDKVYLIYNKFKNAATQVLTMEQFLPIVQEEETDVQAASDYLYEPSKEEIVNDLIPKSLKIQFYKALLDSYAAEHGARMTAMHKATDNASDLLRELKLEYNKARQASITSEILEIVSGAEALNG